MNSEFVELSSAGKRVWETEGRKMGRLGRGEGESSGFGLAKLGRRRTLGEFRRGEMQEFVQEEEEGGSWVSGG